MDTIETELNELKTKAESLPSTSTSNEDFAKLVGMVEQIYAIVKPA